MYIIALNCLQEHNKCTNQIFIRDIEKKNCKGMINNYTILSKIMLSKSDYLFCTEILLTIINVIIYTHSDSSDWLCRCHKMQYLGLIEGMHDAVRTYMRVTMPRSMVYILYGAVWRKQQNLLLLLIYFIARFEISSECVFYYYCHSVVIWFCDMN